MSSSVPMQSVAKESNLIIQFDHRYITEAIHMVYAGEPSCNHLPRNLSQKGLKLLGRRERERERERDQSNVLLCMVSP